MSQAIFQNVDLASISLYAFWLFFAALIFYLQRENSREGYPLVDDDGEAIRMAGLFPVPEDKTFKLMHGRGTVSVPSGQNPERADIAMRRGSVASGYPMVPTGDPMIDGVGPASWAARRDAPELNAHGHPKIRPLSQLPEFFVSSGNDPRGLPVIAGDGAFVGTVDDMWVDESEQEVRYLQIALEGGAGSRLVPYGFARIWGNRVYVRSIFGKHFANVPVITGASQITKLEEEKVAAYYGGGMLYASADRQEPVLG